MVCLRNPGGLPSEVRNLPIFNLKISNDNSIDRSLCPPRRGSNQWTGSSTRDSNRWTRIKNRRESIESRESSKCRRLSMILVHFYFASSFKVDLLIRLIPSYSLIGLIGLHGKLGMFIEQCLSHWSVKQSP